MSEPDIPVQGAGAASGSEPVAGDRPPAIGQEEADPAPPCPYCGSTEAELHSLFGNMQLASQYYCQGCNTVFDAIAWRERGGEASS
jgi:hypothetical protein